jgi:DNA mismatch repair protein MutS2
MKAREDALRQREETVRRKTEDRLDDRLREARREIDQVIEDLKKKAAEMTAQAERQLSKRTFSGPPISTGDAGTARVEARLAVEAAATRFHGGESPRAEGPTRVEARPSVGDRVAVAGLGLEGTLAALHGGDAEVDMQGKRLRARVADLRLLSKAGGGAAAAAPVNVSVQLHPRGDGTTTDLNVIGCTVDEALARTERFLDETLLCDQRTIRVIHGYGTGQLRRAIAEYLRNHPLVSSYQQAAPEKGGGGVTVVELKE